MVIPRIKYHRYVGSNLIKPFFPGPQIVKICIDPARAFQEGRIRVFCVKFSDRFKTFFFGSRLRQIYFKDKFFRSLQSMYMGIYKSGQNGSAFQINVFTVFSRLFPHFPLCSGQGYPVIFHTERLCPQALIVRCINFSIAVNFLIHFLCLPCV